MPVMPISVDLRPGELLGEQIELLMRTVSDMKGSYRDEEARQNLPQDMVVYRVQSLHPVAEGNEGGLFWALPSFSRDLSAMSTS